MSRTQPIQNPNPLDLTSIGKVAFWIHMNPTAAEIRQTAVLLFGLSLLAVTPFLETKTMIISAITGTVLTISMYISLLYLDILLFPPHHDMKNHVYTPKTHQNSRLYYEGHVPILSIDFDNP